MARSSSSGARRGGGSSSGSRSTSSSSGRSSGGRRSSGVVNRSSSSVSRSTSGNHNFGGNHHRNSAPPPPQHNMHQPPPRHNHFRPAPPPRHNHHHPAPPPRRSTTYYNTGVHQQPRRATGTRRGSCLSYIIVLVILFGVLIVASFITNRNSNKNSNSSYNNGHNVISQSGNLNSSITTDVSDASKYFSDRADFISDKATLLSGLKEYEKKTGVTPFLYLTDSINGNTDPTDEEMDTFTCELYDQLFTDENHFLLVFFENDDYYLLWYVCGNEIADSVSTSDTEKVLDYIDKYYENTTLSYEELFSKAYRSAANDIAK